MRQCSTEKVKMLRVFSRVFSSFQLLVSLVTGVAAVG